jgi:RNA-directed DNA polymerase
MVEPRTAPSLPPKAPLPDLHSTAALAELVGLSPDKLTFWAWRFPRHQSYRYFEIARRGGGVRGIQAPIAPLKKIQRDIATALGAAYRAPAHVHGFTRHRSPKTNASVHVGQRFVFAIDLADFFPTVTDRRVKGLFRAWPFEYPEEVAILLVRLCCFGGVLPQGAPTSPIISNYVCRGMDRKLAALARANGCFYSRYADDLVFSTDRSSFPPALAYLNDGRAMPGVPLRAVVDGAGFSINESKTRMQTCFARQRVTGLIINEKVNLPRSYIRGLRAVLHIWRRYGAEDAARSLRRAGPESTWPPGKPYPSLEQVVRGRVMYVAHVRGKDDPVFLNLARKLEALDPHFEFRPAAAVRPLQAKLYTEGTTDIQHIRAALRYFHARGDFQNLTLIDDENSDCGSDQQLLGKCKLLKEHPPNGFAVCLFDTDTKIARDAVGEEGWLAYGPKVVAVGLAAPSGEDSSERLCIELLHPEAIRKTKDAKGRRVYRNDEFDPTTTIHRSEPCKVPYSGGGKGLIATDVLPLKGKGNIARAKTAFARAVEHEPESFESLDFAGFRATFERIATALVSLDLAEHLLEGDM